MSKVRLDHGLMKTIRLDDYTFLWYGFIFSVLPKLSTMEGVTGCELENLIRDTTK